ncbi:hypothetical protein AMOL_2730 [Malaciobacter molluscorum LMG 25693]|uniref:Uncharacterized protein n=1 Tax=Malaciobacter molluscorum LMG 25693 TaxID=870501 RepID=A0AB33H0A2_9BACT|nr:hypothetical protein AMOL_2730 [Malaciobacter molluscorum LMG 25693]
MYNDNLKGLIIDLVYIIFICLMVIPVTYYTLELVFSNKIYEKQKNKKGKIKKDLL